MATNFSANQYENSFAAKRLQNWEAPASFKERPSQHEGYTRPIANDRGHLLQGIPRSQKCPWGGFSGTWDSSQSHKSRLVAPPGKIKFDGNAEILTVHSPSAPRSGGKENPKEPAPVPIPEPFDEKNIGISKHIESVKEAERKEAEKAAVSPVPSPAPKTAERAPTPAERCN